MRPKSGRRPTRGFLYFAWRECEIPKKRRSIRYQKKTLGKLCDKSVENATCSWWDEEEDDSPPCGGDGWGKYNFFLTLNRRADRREGTTSCGCIQI